MIKWFFRCLGRGLWWLMALVFVLSLAVAGGLLVLGYSLYRGWARLRGRPVPPWGGVWARQATWTQWVRRGPAMSRASAQVIDVQARTVRASDQTGGG